MNNEFRTQLIQEFKNVSGDENRVVITADKTNNLYKIDKHEYSKNVHDCSKAKYKKANDGEVDRVKKEAYGIAASLNLYKRIDKFAQNESVITAK